MHDKIIIKGAREHNLKNINLEIPKNKLVVITGLSGSGKSTLAFDTIYAEGQRRYVESLSAYARQFLELMDKPDVDSIDGLSPAISIQQKTTSKNPRSTVSTVTEIYDYLRLLYARIGIPHCPQCNRKITSQSADSITDSVLRSVQGGKNTMILAPVIQSKKGTYEKLFDELKQDGFARIRLDGEIITLEDENEEKSKYPRLNKQKKHTIEVIVDRLKPSPEEKSRLFESIQSALKVGNGLVIASIDGKDMLYSQRNACPYCRISLGDLEPRTFSFNSPFGACNNCNGLGIKIEFDPELIIPDKSKSILEGAVKPWSGHFATFRSAMLRDVGKRFGFDLYTQISKMTDQQLKVILYGTDENIHYKYESKYSDTRWEYRGSFEGIIPSLERIYKQTESESKREELMQFMRELPCDDCHGRRLRREALSVKIQQKSIMDVCDLSIDDCYRFFKTIELSETNMYIAKTILKEIVSRLDFLRNVGLNYLTLNRMTATLSGGESQRIRLATQIGSNLTGVLYVLDEPTIGLHQRDNARLIDTLKKLRDLDNTLLVVEHDEEVIRNADWVVDIGPGAGIHGGEIVGNGSLEDILKNENSITGAFLRGDRIVSHVKQNRNKNPEKWITVHGAQENNLKSINAQFPLGCMTVVTGVSGSGKSTLVNDILFKALSHYFYGSREKPGKHSNISGLDQVDKIIGIDQSPIGRTPRSNAATYVNAFTPIRELFAKTHQAKEMGYKAGRFSFNVSAGRCEACEGGGVRKIEMQFLPDVYVTCDECKGKRYNSETLSIKYRGKTISDILHMTVEEALEFFANVSVIEKKLRTLNDVGLGYIHLGQPATTLSGGEAQRVKLAAELSKRDTGKTVYILDEPTTGLHFADVSKLLHVLKRLVDLGNTVIVIEHNLDVIASADWIIDLGPEGGEKGGEIVVAGTPDEIARNENGSYTGKYLKPKLLIDQIIQRGAR
ncbi:MAG TPA: excinuclease ABC subunit UvrA [Nitrososphaeraceae archaeon]|jgi:excinuclease ABC subunit A|nr:excinuclease ABC subunit UvrA [Nitrososphaeraceae archaeon]